MPTRSALVAHFADGRRRVVLGHPTELAAWSSKGMIAAIVAQRAAIVDEDGHRLRVLAVRQSYLAAPQFSPDGSLLLLGSRIIETVNWKTVARVSEDAGETAAWAPDSSKLAITGRSGAVFLWRKGSDALQLLDHGWLSEGSVWHRPPAWTPDSCAFFVGSAAYDRGGIPTRLLASRLREFFVEPQREGQYLPPFFEWLDLDSPAVSERGFVAARSGSCRRADLVL